MTLAVSYLVFFSAVTIEATAYIAIGVMVAMAWFFLQARLLAVLIAVPAVLAMLSGASVMGPASLLSPIVIIGLGASALLYRKPLLPLLGMAAALGVSVLFTSDIKAVAYAAVPPILGALALALLTARSVRRVTVVLWLSVLMATLWLIPSAISIYTQYGDLSADTLSRFLTELRTSLLAAFEEALAVSGDTLPAEVREMFSEDMLNSFMDLVLTVAPALLAILASLVAFFADFLALLSYRVTGFDKKLAPEARVFAPSKLSAVVFLVTLVVSFLDPGQSQDIMVLSVSATNISMMLTAPFMLVGLVNILAFLRRQRGCLNIWMVGAILVFAPYLLMAAITPLALWGAVLTLLHRGPKPHETLSQ